MNANGQTNNAYIRTHGRTMRGTVQSDLVLILSNHRMCCLLMCSAALCCVFRLFDKMPFSMWKWKMYYNFMWAASNIDAIPHPLTHEWKWCAVHKRVPVHWIECISRHTNSLHFQHFTSLCALRFSTHSAFHIANGKYNNIIPCEEISQRASLLSLSHISYPKPYCVHIFR